jgi:hypothetical protein
MVSGEEKWRVQARQQGSPESRYLDFEEAHFSSAFTDDCDNHHRHHIVGKRFLDPR